MEKYKPSFLCGWLTVNRQCNNRCGWCYTKDVEFQGEDLPVGLAQELLKLMKDVGLPRVIILGGEPTLYEPLPDIINFAAGLGLRVSMASNGRRFSDRAYLERIMGTDIENSTISIKAGNSAQYKELTGRDGYWETIQGIKEMKELMGFVSAIALSKQNETFLV